MNSQEGRFPPGTGQGGSACGAPALFPRPYSTLSLIILINEMMTKPLSVTSGALCLSLHLPVAGIPCRFLLMSGDFPGGNRGCHASHRACCAVPARPLRGSGFPSQLSQRQHHACCIRKRMRRFHHAGDKTAVTLRGNAVSRQRFTSLQRSPAQLCPGAFPPFKSLSPGLRQAQSSSSV